MCRFFYDGVEFDRSLLKNRGLIDEYITLDLESLKAVSIPLKTEQGVSPSGHTQNDTKEVSASDSANKNALPVVEIKPTASVSNPLVATKKTSDSFRPTAQMSDTQDFNATVLHATVLHATVLHEECSTAMEPTDSEKKLLVAFLKMISSPNKTKSPILKFGNRKIVFLATLKTYISSSSEKSSSKAFVPSPFEPGIPINTLQPSQLQDSSSFGSSPNSFYGSSSDTGDIKQNDLENGVFDQPGQDARQDLESSVLWQIPYEDVCQPLKEEQYDSKLTDFVFPSFPLKTYISPNGERKKEPPDVRITDTPQFAQEKSYNPNSTLSVCCNYFYIPLYPPNDANSDVRPHFKFTVDELAGLQGDGYKSKGMLRPLSSIDMSRPSDPRVDSLLLPIEATTHPPRTFLASDNQTQTVVFETTVIVGFGTVVSAVELDIQAEN